MFAERDEDTLQHPILSYPILSYPLRPPTALKVVMFLRGRKRVRVFFSFFM